MCNRVVVVWKSRLIRQGMTNWRWPQSRPCDDFGFWWWLLSGWWLSGIEKTWWLGSERPWVWNFLVDCADDNNCDGNHHDYDRVAKTCRPCRPVGANFSWPVLIFGPFWVIFGPFGQFWVIFGPIWAILGHFWAILGNFRSFLDHFLC